MQLDGKADVRRWMTSPMRFAVHCVDSIVAFDVERGEADHWHSGKRHVMVQPKVDGPA
jgi:hypothetical protein